MSKIYKILFIALSLISISGKSIKAMEADTDFQAYGGEEGHKYFEETSVTIVHNAADHIRALKKFVDEKPGRRLANYHDSHFLGSTNAKKGLANERHKIAIHTKSKNAEEFGLLRSSATDPFRLDASYPTGLWRQKIFQVIQGLLIKNLDQIVLGDTCFELSENMMSCCKIDVLPKSMAIGFADRDEVAFSKLSQESQINLHLEQKAIRKLYASFYGVEGGIERANKFRKDTTDIVNGGGEDPEYIRVVTFMFTKMFPTGAVEISQIYTWVETDQATKETSGLSLENIAKMSKESPVLIRHTMTPEIPILTGMASLAWEKAILLDQKSGGNLSQHLSDYAFYRAHPMPYSRGTAALIKWAMQAICEYHGLEFAYDGEIDKDALNHFCPMAFRKYFNQRVRFSGLKPLEESVGKK